MQPPSDRIFNVTVGGAPYRLRKMDARTASWIAVQLLTKMLPFGMDEQLVSGATAKLNRGSLSEDEFRGVQDHALRVVDTYATPGTPEAPVPIIFPGNGRLLPALEFEAVTLLELTALSLKFSVGPFLTGDALTRIMAALVQAPALPGTPSSTLP